MTSNPAGDRARPPVLVARLGREQCVFPVGMQIRVGRDPALELVSINPLVSRDTHGLITSYEKGAIYTDRSRRGTFLDGKRLTNSKSTGNAGYGAAAFGWPPCTCSGCFAIQVSAEQLGLAELPSGTYQIQLYGGPTLAPIGTATAVSIGDRGTAGSQ